MKLTNFEKCLLKCISFTAIVQGFVWAALSLTCIVLYKSAHDLDITAEYSNRLPYELYFRFLKEKNETMSHFVIRPPDFTAFMWVYFLSSSIWIALSIDQYFALHSNKNRVSIVMSLWSVTTIALSIIDIIFMGLLARDYSNCPDITNTENLFCFITNGIGFTLAARGFSLWIFNVGSALVMLSFGIRIHRENYVSKAIRIPRAQLASNISNNNNGWIHHPNPQHGSSQTNPSPSPHNFQRPNSGYDQGVHRF